MVEVLLFLGIMLLFFFIPVEFRIYYWRKGPDDRLFLELSFLSGLLRRKKVVRGFKAGEQRLKKTKQAGRWFFLRRTQVEVDAAKPAFDLAGFFEFLERNRHYGFGVTLLTYFLPAQYHHWLLVTEELEKKGSFSRFHWTTCLGTGEAAMTAVLYGLLYGAKMSLVTYLHRHVGFSQKPQIRVLADYQQLRLDMLFDGIFRVKLGHIISAALIARFRQRILKGGVGIERASN